MAYFIMAVIGVINYSFIQLIQNKGFKLLKLFSHMLSAGVVYIGSFFIIPSAYAVFPNDPGFGHESKKALLHDIAAPEAWEITTGSKEVVVGLIGKGIDYTHEDLIDNMWVNPKEIADNGLDDDGNGVIDDVHGYNAFDDNGDPMNYGEYGTEAFHASMEAGIIGAKGNNGFGVVGVNWDVSLAACRVMDMEVDIQNLTLLDECLRYFINLKQDYGINIKVIHIGISGAYSDENAAVWLKAAADVGILLVVPAAVNNNNEQATYPMSYHHIDGILTVTAYDLITKVLNLGTREPNYIDMAVPWDAALARDFSFFMSSSLPSFYAYMNKPSHDAAAHVSGAAALVWSIYPDLTAAEMKHLLMHSGTPVTSLESTTVSGKSLNIANALAVAEAMTPVREPAPDTPPTAHVSEAQTVWVGDMVWLDGSESHLHPGSDANMLSFHWDVVATPADSNVNATSLSNSSDMSPSFTPDVTGSYMLSLMVSDGIFDSEVVMVTVTANDGSIDTDNDGLTDEYETNHSFTDPMLADTDGDNIPDGHEVNASLTNPLVQDLCFGEKATHWGTSGDDRINGTHGEDVIMTFGGNDTVHGWDKADRICGGAGNDVIYGKRGTDFIDGGAGDDYIHGNAGHDVVLGGDGNDILIGGNKNDHLDGGAGTDSCDGGTGINDTLNCEA
ncbi:S8 family serine peptidase [uncultured Shewanella sp.]|uniref:S8 family serine peptidase n=1 Tax=uncultured Shewanella sp. TaxID=173975 RepID=UPI00260FE170|nr:S8 family serine peptidase [uncultured Shewanella sp.]